MPKILRVIKVSSFLARIDGMEVSPVAKRAHELNPFGSYKTEDPVVSHRTVSP
jgi:hypothetical protein